MIETVTTNVIRCDACNRYLENGDGYRYVFHSDICDECMGLLLQKIESEKILSKEVFDELVDDLKYKI